MPSWLMTIATAATVGRTMASADARLDRRTLSTTRQPHRTVTRCARRTTPEESAARRAHGCRMTGLRAHARSLAALRETAGRADSQPPSPGPPPQHWLRFNLVADERPGRRFQSSKDRVQDSGQNARHPDKREPVARRGRVLQQYSKHLLQPGC